MLQNAFSFLPIVLLVYLMTKSRPLASAIALPLVAFVVYVAMLAVFGHSLLLVHANVLDGLLTALTPISIIWGAIFLFRTMEETKSMEVLRDWLNSVSHNRVAQLMIVGWAFAFLVEGASGFGTPAALAAPILIGLGFKPLPVGIMVLTMNTVPVSFGAVGTPTWFGFSGIDLSNAEITSVGIKTAVMQSVASLIMPVLALRFVVPWTELRKNLGFVYLSVLTTMLPHMVVACVSYEFPSLVGGATGLLGSILIASRGWGLEVTTPEVNLPEVTSSKQKREANIPRGALIKAGFPIWGTILLLVLTRIPQLGIKAWLNTTTPLITGDIGELGAASMSSSLVVSLDGILGTSVSWSHKTLYVPSLLPFAAIACVTFLIQGSSLPTVRKVFVASLWQMKSPVLALLGALVFVKLMMMGEDGSAVNRIGATLAQFSGSTWYAIAAILGALGSFFSGSATISNLTFGPIQDRIADDLSLNRTTVLALQSVGAAMGNMVCINNIVAVCSVIALPQKEGHILKRTASMLIPYAAITALVAILAFR